MCTVSLIVLLLTLKGHNMEFMSCDKSLLVWVISQILHVGASLLDQWLWWIDQGGYKTDDSALLQV